MSFSNMFVNKLSDHWSRRHSPTPTDGLSCATAPRTPSVTPSVETASPQATSFSECAGGWEKTTLRMPRSTWISSASSEQHTNSKVGITLPLVCGFNHWDTKMTTGWSLKTKMLAALSTGYVYFPQGWQTFSASLCIQKVENLHLCTTKSSSAK